VGADALRFRANGGRDICGAEMFAARAPQGRPGALDWLRQAPAPGIYPHPSWAEHAAQLAAGWSFLACAGGARGGVGCGAGTRLGSA